MNLSFEARRRLFITAIIFFLVLVVTVVFFYAFRGNPYGDEVIIKNYRETVKNLSGDYENLIMSSLYHTIDLNMDNVPEIQDATIRNDSATQTYEKTDNVYRGSFIVDMESIKQSYFVEYSYSPDPNSSAIGGYAIIVSCLPVDDLIYGDFNCKDSLTIESGDTDPIVGVLPHSTLTYEIKAIANEDSSVRLVITLLLTRVDYNTREAEAVEQYKQEALSWLRTQGYNPDNYSIEYIY
ncbi:MAG: hypothetical protein WAV04_00700 [Candidatus Microsaccharimonas sp.]